MGSSTGTLGSESRLVAYVEALTRALGHADRAAPLRSYCTGLLLPGARKSVEPMAARVEPAQVQAAHQSLRHFVAKADWSDDALLTAVHTQAPPIIEQRGPIRGWMADDTGIPKKGAHSVGAARQYCGQLGKQDNCQVAVPLSLAADHASLPIAHRLYLPQPWADDPARRAAAGVPADIAFQTKPQIALAQISAAVAAGVPKAPVPADAGYGMDTAFRDGITALGLAYVVGIQSRTSLWPPGTEPLPPKSWSGRGRPPSLIRRDAEHTPMPAKALAVSLSKSAWRRVTWREGSNTMPAGRFAAVRVRPAHRDSNPPIPRPEEWLLIEWPRDELEPTKYWLSTLPPTVTRRAMVEQAKLRWRIERDYQDLKQELGLGHCEGRGWRGFHHHATLCIAAYGSLIAERGAFPPSEGFRPPSLEASALPAACRPRGAPDPA